MGPGHRDYAAFLFPLSMCGNGDVRYAIQPDERAQSKSISITQIMCSTQFHILI